MDDRKQTWNDLSAADGGYSSAQVWANSGGFEPIVQGVAVNVLPR